MKESEKLEKEEFQFFMNLVLICLKEDSVKTASAILLLRDPSEPIYNILQSKPHLQDGETLDWIIPLQIDEFNQAISTVNLFLHNEDFSPIISQLLQNK